MYVMPSPLTLAASSGSAKTGVGRFGLLDPASFLVAIALEVVGVRGPFLSAGRPATGFELEITQVPGVQRRTCPEVALVLCQHRQIRMASLRAVATAATCCPRLRVKRRAG